MPLSFLFQLTDPRIYQTLLVLFLPFLIQQSLRIYTHLRHRPAPRPSARTPLPRTHARALYSLLLLHLLAQLAQLTLLRPPNLFTTLHAPLTAPVSALLTILKLAPRALSPAIVPPALLRALQSTEHRAAYVRYGHAAVAGCDYCKEERDYELFALAGRAVVYAAELLAVMLLTAQWTGRQRARSAIVLLVGAMLAAETYALHSVELDIDDGAEFMWHDNLHLARHALFLLLTPVLFLLPPSASPSAPSSRLPSAASAALPHLSTTLSHTLTSLNFLSLLHASIPRSPALRSALMSHWEKQAREREGVWDDDAFAKLAEEVREREGGGGGGAGWKAAREAVGRLWSAVGMPPATPGWPAGTVAGAGAGAGASGEKVEVG